MVDSSQQRQYFPDLDASRFLAFLAVFLFHAFTSKDPAYQQNDFYVLLRSHLDIAHMGVDYFFSLSSFLISYILLFELQKEGRIQTRNFIMRRILRIWPLYFFILILGFIIVPKLYMLVVPGDLIQLPEALPFLAFYANFYMMEHGASFLFILSILWTISVEEQFYLLWPFVCRIGLKLFPYAAGFLVLLSMVSAFYLEDQKVYYHSLSYGANFGLGAIAAYLLLTKHRILDLIRNMKSVYISLIYIVFLVVVLTYPYWNDLPLISELEKLIFALFFGFFILEQSFSSHSMFKLRRFKWLSKAGRLSYGLYVYHALAIILVGSLYEMLFEESGLAVFVVRPLFAFGLTYLFAQLSYTYLETPFLNLKKWFR